MCDTLGRESVGNLNKCPATGSLHPSSIISPGRRCSPPDSHPSAAPFRPLSGFPSLCLRAPGSSLLFRAFLFIYHHLLNALASLPSFRCQERSRPESVRVRQKIVAVRLRCNIASSCHILPSCPPSAFRLPPKIHAAVTAKDERSSQSAEEGLPLSWL